MDPPPKVKMGKLAQRFNLSQRKRKHDDQASVADQPRKPSFPASQSHPVQLAGSQVLRRSDNSNAPVGPLSIVVGPAHGPRTRDTPSFCDSSGSVSLNPTATALSMEIDNPDASTPEQRQILELEHRLKIANQRVQDLENDARTHTEELLVAKTQATIDIDQEIIKLQQEVETLGEHEDRLIRELVASESKLKDLKTTERDLKKRLSHFHTIYCLKHAYRAHFKKMNYIKRCTAKRLHDKFLETESKYMEAAFDLYEYLEDNGLQDTLPPEVKTWLAQAKEIKS